MTAIIIDGKSIAASKRQSIKHDIDTHNLKPKLAIILASNNPASKIYVSRKIAACKEVGIEPVFHELAENTQAKDIIAIIQTLNNDKSVHGIFLQLPIADSLNANDIIQTIHSDKDVDGLTITNMGKIMSGDDSGLTPCTPQGVMEILNHENIDLTGKHAVIIGRSLLFGKPMGQLLLQANCTVTQCHSKTENLSTITKQADILIAAAGQANMVKGDWVKSSVIVIDVGINRTDDGKITGDVDFETVSQIASAITPVPGGVGPMTVASLLANTVKACRNLN